MELLAEIARQHLPTELAERWIRCIRPGLRLRPARGGDTVVGTLGGLPHLPDDVDWPHWSEQRPLCHIATVDLGALPVGATEPHLPNDGILQLFYRDPVLDNYNPIVYSRDRSTQKGARIVYIPGGVSTFEREPPPGIVPCGHLPLAAEPIASGPGIKHPELRDLVQRLDVNALRAFHEAKDCLVPRRPLPRMPGMRRKFKNPSKSRQQSSRWGPTTPIRRYTMKLNAGPC